ncbi:CAP domain-containing protein [uncultured Roseivirga sp.]|uniref:CAP domain-containing protein n=1 Tax=uncultured Roseivirga sp. TaxID=543088 RepID=UPI0030DA15AB|tara:strand:- start:13239 stop:13907 length:669 start_codon:yes stop_codon:yes gene_type:complete
MKSFKSLILFTLLLFGCLSLSAQRKWDDKYYNELNDNNFRSFKLFKAPIDLNKVDYKVLNAALFFISNEARIEKGIAPLAYQRNLEIMAWNHSVEMGKEDFFDHINKKDKKRKTPEKRAALAGIVNPNISENISAVGGVYFGSYLELADHVVDKWVKSPSHAKTLYSENVLQMGCGAYYYKGVWQGNKAIWKQGDGFWLATQNFQSFAEIVSEKSKDKDIKN